MQGRGSKPVVSRDLLRWVVAPHAGARIETSDVHIPDSERGCRPSCRGADRNMGRARRLDGPIRSPLMQGRGSKPCVSPIRSRAPPRRPSCRGADRNNDLCVGIIDIDGVAPHAGARIETLKMERSCTAMTVAPHAGARIETSSRSIFSTLCMVAPHAGARIETNRIETKGPERSSPLMQGRGSKRISAPDPRGAGWSPLMQGRGSKRKRG